PETEQSFPAPASSWRELLMTLSFRGAAKASVAASPESITTDWDCGFRALGLRCASAAPRNDDLRSRRRLAIHGDTRVDEGNRLVDNRIAHSFLRGDALHQPVHPFDIRRAGKQRPRRRGWPYQRLRSVCIFLERYQIVARGAELDAEIAHPVVDCARGCEIAVHGVLDRARRILLHAAIIAGQQHRPFGERHENRIMHLELHGELNLVAVDFVAD